MPEIGEIKKGRDIGKSAANGSGNFIWHACEGCGKERWVQLQKGMPTHNLCLPCFYKSNRGNRNKNWKGGRVKAGNGSYIAIKLQPDDFFYPMTNTNGYVLEHRLIVAKALCRCLLPWEIVHHRLGFAKDDNRYPGTLQLLPTQTKHMPSIQTKRRLNELEKRITLLEAENTILHKQLEETLRVTTK